MHFDIPFWPIRQFSVVYNHSFDIPVENNFPWKIDWSERRAPRDLNKFYETGRLQRFVSLDSSLDRWGLRKLKRCSKANNKHDMTWHDMTHCVENTFVSFFSQKCIEKNCSCFGMVDKRTFCTILSRLCKMSVCYYPSTIQTKPRTHLWTHFWEKNTHTNVFFERNTQICFFNTCLFLFVNSLASSCSGTGRQFPMVCLGSRSAMSAGLASGLARLGPQGQVHLRLSPQGSQKPDPWGLDQARGAPQVGEGRRRGGVWAGLLQQVRAPRFQGTRHPGEGPGGPGGPRPQVCGSQWWHSS